MLWTAALCLVRFVNSIVWAGNVDNVAPIWCDISTQVILGAGIGIPASILCISRRLYNITSVQTASITHKDKRRAVLADLAIALGIPLIIMVLHIIVHPHRFDILEDIGCQPVTYNTLLAYFLYFMWPIVLGVISLVYTTLNLRAFYIRRLQFQQLMSHNSAISASRYLRLIILSCVDALFTVPFSIYVVYIATHGVTLAPWISWEETHFNFQRVDRIPALFWRQNKSFTTSVELNRWLAVFCAFVFFALFGFASEAQKHYKLAFWWVAKKFGYQPAKNGGNKLPMPNFKPASGGILPSFVKPNVPGKIDTGAMATSSSSTDDIPLSPYPEKGSFPSSPSTPSSAPPSYTHDPDHTQHDEESSVGSPSGSYVSLPETVDPRQSLYTVQVSISDTIYSQARSITPPPVEATCRDVTPASTSSSRAPSRSATPSQNLNGHDSVYVRPVTPCNRIYLAEAYHPAVPLDRPSPPPFNDVTFNPDPNAIPHYHRPFAPMSLNPLAKPHAGSRGLDDAIVVTIHKHSESSEGL
ncbi:a-factor receptor [Paramarasmius palmivorus]|uniref:A-factor receptor n=1 Tax=Paramarasmius palmivorus TaxID=297713 RepID=A0AAW0BK08_9AGAR